MGKRGETRLAWSSEEEDVPVGVGDLEAAEAVVGVLEGRAEDYVGGGEFGSEGIGVGGIDEGVPAHGGVAAGVWERWYILVGLDEELGSVAAEDGEEGILVRLLESRFKAEFVAVEGDGPVEVADDEEGGDCRGGGSCHRRVESDFEFALTVP